jgi:uncharacterized SAM-binding protein YcdF (DUF218 family)
LRQSPLALGLALGQLEGDMRRLFNLIFQLLAVALVVFLLTAVWIVFDGLSDWGEKADVALVTGHTEVVQGTSDPLLDRVVQLYKDGEFPDVIIIGTKWVEIGSENAVTMAKYLEAHGIPSSAIIDDSVVDTVPETASRVAATMKEHGFQSVMVVADYYRITRIKLALTHEGILELEKAHVGKLQKEDALKIGREEVALYEYIGKVYLLPAAEKVKKEAQVGMSKASIDGEKAKEKMDKSLDNLAK